MLVRRSQMTRLKRLTDRIVLRRGWPLVATSFLIALASASVLRLGAAVLAAAASGLPSAPTAAAAGSGTAIRPFRIDIPDADLADLRRRIVATRWSERETDPTQGVPL